MKIQSLIVLLLLVFGTGIKAQITITNQDMPGSGDTLRYSDADPLLPIDMVTTGPNSNWDYSNLMPVNQGLESYKSAFQISVVYNLFFGLTAFGRLIEDTLNLGVVTLTNVYDFYVKNSSVFKAVGRGYEFSGIPTPVNYSNDDEIYQFPLQYNDHDSSTFSVAHQLPGFGSYVSYGSRVNDVDGWGSITTPFGTFNALRVKTTMYQTDSIYIEALGFGFALPRVYFEYKWLANGQKFPILEITTNQLFGNETVTRVRYRDHYRNLGALYAPVADFVASDTVVTDQDIVAFTNLTNYAPQNFYQWSFVPNTINYHNGTTQTSKNPEVQFNNAGFYTATLQVMNPYGQDTMTKTNYILVTSTVGLESASLAEQVNVFPNPVTDYMVVDGGKLQIDRIRILAADGKTVKDLPADAPSSLHALNLGFLAPGSYILWLHTTEGVLAKPFLKQ